MWPAVGWGAARTCRGRRSSSVGASCGRTPSPSWRRSMSACWPTPGQRADALPAPILDRSLAALEAELTGARSQAAGDLAALNWEQPDVLAPGYAEHPYVIALSRLTAAKWLREAGD